MNLLKKLFSKNQKKKTNQDMSLDQYLKNVKKMQSADHTPTKDQLNIDSGMFYKGTNNSYGKCIIREGHRLTVFAFSSKWPYGETGSLNIQNVDKIITKDHFKAKMIEIVMNHPDLREEQKKPVIQKISEKVGL